MLLAMCLGIADEQMPVMNAAATKSNNVSDAKRWQQIMLQCIVSQSPFERLRFAGIMD
jgi:hypothetical protein